MRWSAATGRGCGPTHVEQRDDQLGVDGDGEDEAEEEEDERDVVEDLLEAAHVDDLAREGGRGDV